MSDDAMPIPNEWEFYPCIVDDAPASILLNMWFRSNFKKIGCETLYYGRIAMVDGDEHGMGTKSEAETLFELEDVITGVLADSGLFNVGRLRTAGGWQLSFYGPPGLESQVDSAFGAALREREYSIGSQEDPEWGYYNEFLYPDRERLQWIANRRQVETLAEHGDVLDADRPVDHFVYFTTTESRDQFVASLPVNGFPKSTKQEHSGDPKDPYVVQVVRNDPVELHHIHDVVMDLAILAEKFGGDYDGWGAPLVKLDTGDDKPLN